MVIKDIDGSGPCNNCGNGTARTAGRRFDDGRWIPIFICDWCDQWLKLGMWPPDIEEPECPPLAACVSPEDGLYL